MYDNCMRRMLLTSTPGVSELAAPLTKHAIESRPLFIGQRGGGLARAPCSHEAQTGLDRLGQVGLVENPDALRTDVGFFDFPHATEAGIRDCGRDLLRRARQTEEL